MVTTQYDNGIYTRLLSSELMRIKRKADKNLISQHLYLTIIQVVEGGDCYWENFIKIARPEIIKQIQELLSHMNIPHMNHH